MDTTGGGLRIRKKGGYRTGMKAFYFSANRKLRYGDNRCIRIGRTHRVVGKPSPCVFGLHGCKRLIDALGYAPGNILYLVELSGDIVCNEDKCAATERTYIASFNAEKHLQEFARKQALINIEKIKNYCSYNGFDIINRWLLTGDISLKSAAYSVADFAARSMTDSTAYFAAHSAARSAADFAVFSAAHSVADFAARSTAYSKVDFAAYSTAYSEAFSAANEMLTDMVRKATRWNI